MVDIVVWAAVISVIVLSIINKDSSLAALLLVALAFIALGVFTYQIMANQNVPNSYYEYLSFSNFIAVIVVLLFFLCRILKIRELREVGMHTFSISLVLISTIIMAHQYWGYSRISYFHLILILAGAFFYIAEQWRSITVFKVLAIIFANACFFYLVYIAFNMEGGINYSNLSQAVVMKSGVLVACIVFFAYYLVGHDIISEKHANRFLGVGVSLMAAGTVYWHPEASAVAFKPFHSIKGLLAAGDLGAVAYGVAITVFAKTRVV